MGSDFARHLAGGADRDADDDEIGAFDRRGVALHHLIGDAELRHALAGFGGAGGGDDRTHRALSPRGTRDRAADQPHADQREAVVNRCVGHAVFPKKSANAFTTSRLASSVPTDMRNAFGSL